MLKNEESLVKKLGDERDRAKSQAELVNLVRYLGYTLAPMAVSFIAGSGTTFLEKGLTLAGVIGAEIIQHKVLKRIEVTLLQDSERYDNLYLEAWKQDSRERYGEPDEFSGF